MPFHFVFRFFSNGKFQPSVPPWVCEKKIWLDPFRRNCRKNIAAKSDSFANSSLNTGKKLPMSHLSGQARVKCSWSPSHQDVKIKINSNISGKWDTSDEFFLPICSTPPKKLWPSSMIVVYLDCFLNFQPMKESGTSFVVPVSKKNGLPFEGKWHQHFFSDRYFGLGPRRAPNSESSYLRDRTMKLRFGN